MTGHLRALAAIVTGFLVTSVLTYVGAVVLLLIRMGIPLGSEGRAPTGGEYAGLLAIAGAAAAIGGHIAAGIARDRSRAVVTALAALLAAAAWWSFWQPGSQWPAWWGPALALVFGAATWLSSEILPSRRPPLPAPRSAERQP